MQSLTLTPAGPGPEAACGGEIHRPGPKPPGLAGTVINLLIQPGLVIVIMAEGGMNLRQRQVRMLKMNFRRTPPVDDHVQCHLDNFGVRVVYPRHVTVIQPNMCRR